MATLTRKQGDTGPDVTSTLQNGDGSAVDLTSAVVKFNLKSSAGIVIDDHAAATIDSPATAGNVRYALQAKDTAAPGLYHFEWEVTFPSGQIITYPNDSDLLLNVVSQVD